MSFHCTQKALYIHFIIVLCIFMGAEKAYSDEVITSQDARNFILSRTNGSNQFYNFGLSFPEDCNIRVTEAVRGPEPTFTVYWDAALPELFIPTLNEETAEDSITSPRLIGHGRVITRSTPISDEQLENGYSNKFLAFLEDAQLLDKCNESTCKESVPWMPFFFSNSQDFIRLTNAFQFLIEDCGGSAEKF